MDRNPLTARVVRRGLLAVVIVTLTGCTARTGPAHTGAEQPSRVAAAAHQASPTRSATAEPAARHYADARSQWRRGASQSSARQPKYWTAAAADLSEAERAGAAGHARYATAITELRQLATLPDAQQTPAQNAEYHHDIDALNGFFRTPGLYS